jgi:hypothetical protein
VIWALCGACTEPNPYLPRPAADTGTTAAVDADAGSSTSGGTTVFPGGQDTASTGATTCADRGMACVPAAPAGFSGPFAWLERPTDAAIECAGPFAEQLVEAFSEISAPAASCACNCAPPTNASCSPITIARYSGGGCAGAPVGMLELQPGCNDAPGWASGASYSFTAPTVQGGGCFPLLSVERPTAKFLTRHVACGGALAADGCEPGQLCAPAPDDPFHPRWCVWQEGDVPCPEGDYAARTLLYRDIDDRRGCEPCSCAPPSGPCQNGVVVLSSIDGCGFMMNDVVVGECQAVGTVVQSMHFDPGAPPPCTPGVVVPTGEAAGAEPVTFCCTP